MTFTLLGCPFCGKPPKVIESGWHAIIRCDNEYCGADVEVVGTERGAVLEFWNTRATASLEGDAVERVARIIDEYSRGAFTGWKGKTGDSAISLDEAEDHFSLCMQDLKDAVLATGLVPDEAAVRADEREKCAKVCDQIRNNAERRAAQHENGEARNSALDKMEGAIQCAAAIRSGGGE